MPPIAWQLVGQLAAGNEASLGCPISCTVAYAGAASASAQTHVKIVASFLTTRAFNTTRRSSCGYGSVLMDPFEDFARAGMEQAGLEIDDVDLAVMRAAHAAYGPALRALDAADVHSIRSEPDLDPGLPPSDW
jgi:hypothetical protein